MILDTQPTDHLEQRLSRVDSLGELRAFVAATSRARGAVDRFGRRPAGGGGVGGLERLLAGVREKLETLAAEEGAESYRLSVAGGRRGSR